MQQKITALLITLNEEGNIRDILNNLSFTDEIIVVDSYSEDHTAEIIKNEFKNVQLIQRVFKDFSDQRNFAIAQAKNKWILFPDADERISDELKDEIIGNLTEPGNSVAFGMKRNFYFKDKLIRYSGYQTHIVYRIFHKDHCKFDEKKVHETLIINGKVKKLKQRLDHYSFTDETGFKNKLTKYAQLRAEELLENKKNPNFYHFHLKPLYRFMNQYFMRLGFLDGKEGYRISKLNAFEVKQRYLILKRMLENQKSKVFYGKRN